MDVTEALAALPQEGAIEEMETPVVSPTTEQPVEKVAAETPSQEGDQDDNTPDEGYSRKTEKRITQLLDERLAQSQRADELERQLAEAKATKAEPQEEIPARFVKLYGDDPETYREWKAMQDEQKSAWIEEAHTKFLEKQTKETEEAEAMAQSYESQLDELSAAGKEFDRNELKKAMTDRPIWKTDGTPDWETKLELMELKKPQPSQARKSVAPLGKSGGTTNKEWAGPDDFTGYAGK